jgi:hypothetical protein
MTEVLTEAERRGRRRRLIVIVVVAGLILAAFLLFGRLRSRALDDKADAATTALRPAWRAIDLPGLRDADNQSTVDANNSGDFSASMKLFPGSHDATFISADLSMAGAVAARYSIETWAGEHLLLRNRRPLGRPWTHGVPTVRGIWHRTVRAVPRR